MNTEKLYQYLTVDLNIFDLQSVRFKQYNKNSQRLMITVTENNQPYFVDKNSVTCALKMITPDDRAIYNDCTVNDDGTITVDITESCCVKSGNGKAELNIIRNEDNFQICTMNFHVIIEPSVYENDKAVAAPEFDLLTKSIAENKQLQRQITEAENKRIADEDERKQNELSRIDSENIREANEILRNDKENIRDQNESDRISSEHNRADSEVARSQNESLRENAETDREDAEQRREQTLAAAMDELSQIKTAAIEASENANNAAEACKNASRTATTEIPGIVKPDGTTITVEADGTIHSSKRPEIATTEAPGIVKPDGKTIKVESDGTITGAASGFTGTKAEVDQAIENNEIKEGMIVNIEDDYEDIQSLQNQIDAITSSTYSLSGGIAIPEGADLKSDTYLTPGNYYCKSQDISQTLSNCPVDYAFILKVEISTGENDPQAMCVRQTFYENGSGKIVCRTYTVPSNTWSNETIYATAQDVDRIAGMVPGGTVDLNTHSATNVFVAAGGSTNTPPLCGSSAFFMQPFLESTYNVQMAFSFVRSVIALRRKDATGWLNWEYFYPDGKGTVHTRKITNSDLAQYATSIGNSSVFVRSGRTVMCALSEIKTSESYASTWNPIVNIPKGFRPVGLCHNLGYGLYTGVLSSVEASGSTIKFVKATGNTASGAFVFYTTLTWITNDDLPE